MAFSIGYYISTFYKGKFGIFLSLFISFISYLIIAFILANIPPHVILTPLIVITLMLIATIYFAKKENFLIEKKIKTSINDIIFRSLLTISIFLIISSLPKYVPSNIAGIFSSFPTILLPLMLIIHFRHSRFQARTIIKNTPYGLSSVVIYSLVVYFSYERIGIVYGTMIALFCSVLYVIIQGKVLRFFKLIK